MRFFSSIVKSCKDIAGKLRLVSASTGDIDTENRQLMQQYGFISIPKSGAKILFLSSGNVTVGVASDSDDRPSLEEGEIAVYASKESYIKLNKDGSMTIKPASGKELFVDAPIRSSGTIQADGDISSSANIQAAGNVSDVKGSIEVVRTIYNGHSHGVTAIDSPTSTPVPPLMT